MELARTSIDAILQWNQALKDQPHPHLLQTWEWGELKGRYGWEATRFAWRDASGNPLALAQILERRTVAGFSILYCPRGPLLDWTNDELRVEVIQGLIEYTKQRNAVFLKIDPEVITSRSTGYSSGVPGGGTDEVHPEMPGQAVKEDLTEAGFQPSEEEIQFRNTMQLDLHPTEEELLARMKQKTRYNIRLASRKGVRAVLGNQEDFEMLYRMYAETSIRDEFTIRDWNYYKDVWNTFHYAGMAQPIIAAFEGKPIAGLILFRHGSTAWYLYGMSRDSHREKMPNHLLQWEAIKWAKATGSSVYDFWGAPDELDPEDRLWGVYRFKAGFGADFVKTIGAWDFINRSNLFRFYSSIMPRLLSLMRARGRTQTQRALE